VFYSEPKQGFFISKISELLSNDNGSKWQKLKNLANAFELLAINVEDDFLKYVSKDFLDCSNLLSNNPTEFISQFFVNKIETKFKVLDENTFENDLWDNLFYQVITQKDFYIKETIMHILVFNNLLKELKKLKTDKEKLDLLPILISARVVLPSNLFDAKKSINEENINTENKNSEQSNEEIQETNRLKAIENSTALEQATLEIKKLMLNQNKVSQIEYQKAQLEHYKLIEPMKSKFQQDIKIAKSKLSPSELAKYDPKDRSNPLNAYAVLPIFEFDFNPKIDEQSMKENLSSASFEILKSKDVLIENENYQDLLQKINEAYNNEQRIIVQNTNYSIPVVIIGGQAIYPIARKGKNSRGENLKVNDAFVPEKFGLRNIGIADYKKVVSHICCYKAGEVSHIENIMAKELRSKTTTVEQIEEITQTDEKQQEKENSTDNSTTQRFEMQSEIAKIMAEDRQISAYTTYKTKSFGEFEIGANYASNSSKEQSNRQAVTQAKEITNRATERIVTKFRTETIKKTTNRFTEQNIHDFDNRQGNQHVSGVYRFVNAIYENQVLNYGKRMMYEFMIPEPSKLHRFGMTITEGIIKTPKMPEDPKTKGIMSFANINEGNYLDLCTNYNAEILPFLAPKTIALQDTQEQIGDNCRAGRSWSYNIPILSGYKLNTLGGTLSFLRHGDIDNDPGASQNVNGHCNIAAKPPMYFGNNPSFNFNIDFPTEIIDNVTLFTETWDIGRITYSLNAGLVINSQAYTEWQQQTFTAIMAGYQKQLDAYNLLLANEKDITVKNIETNPGFYRQIEQVVLRKDCIAYLMDETKMGQGFYKFTDPNNIAPNNKNFANLYIDQSKEMDNYASFAKFIEQAFDWDIMSYNFYPFYWGDRADWTQLYQYECNDPLFRSFMQAGMARVVVTVKPGFENAVMHYMTTGQVWNGGEIPVLGNPLYLSIVDEIREQEYAVEDTWQTVVPTSLIGIQESGVSITGTGLPCDPNCTDPKDTIIKGSTQNLERLINEIPVK
jgi:hypothetical protein